jgi:MFS family permease
LIAAASSRSASSSRASLNRRRVRGELHSLAVSRAAIGFGTAAIVPVANSILGQLFDGPVKASRIAVFNLGLFFGGVAGSRPGWRSASRRGDRDRGAGHRPRGGDPRSRFRAR